MKLRVLMGGLLLAGSIAAQLLGAATWPIVTGALGLLLLIGIPKTPGAKLRTAEDAEFFDWRTADLLRGVQRAYAELVDVVTRSKDTPSGQVLGSEAMSAADELFQSAKAAARHHTQLRETLGRGAGFDSTEIMAQMKEAEAAIRGTTASLRASITQDASQTENENLREALLTMGAVQQTMAEADKLFQETR